MSAASELREEGQGGPLVSVVDLRKTFAVRGHRAPLVAVDDVTLSIARGESLGIVGESGSGKTTLARCLLRLVDATSGKVFFDGLDLSQASSVQLRRLRRRFQVVFQDPYDSLDPRWTVSRIVEEPLQVLTEMSQGERRSRVRELLSLARLGDQFLGRYPHQLSGGQAQRVGIARAIATNPDLVVLDEPTSALDALVRIEILDLLNSLRARLNLTYLYISHDIGSVRRVCDRIAVMYLGTIVEQGPAAAVVADPVHPYTRALMSAVLESRPAERQTRRRLRGELPSPLDPPSGCRFHTRCPIAVPACAETEQRLTPIGPNHLLACSRITSGERIEWPDGWEKPGPTDV
jgi:oligopeptide/dipeptide ABC transporter ATP-binding protein